jgi:SAM-dependent methyltransferase
MAGHPLHHFYPESRLGGFTDVDGTLLFYNRVRALLNPTDTVLDIGCGRGSQADDPIPWRRELAILRGRVARVIGLDVDPAAATNPYIDEFRLVRAGAAWPLADSSVDLVLADFVIEHLDQPEPFFAELQRVLRPGGHFCARTSNRWSYIAMGSRLVPDRLHRQVLARLQPLRQAGDIFPTRFRCNSLWALRRALRKRGIAAVVYGYEAEPSYLGFSRLAYALGVLHQKLAPRCMRVTLFAFGQRRK